MSLFILQEGNGQMYLRDIVIHTEKESFQRHTFCVTDLYLQVLKKRLATTDTAKLIIYVAASPTCKRELLPFGPQIWQMRWYFPFAGYTERAASEKNKAILEYLQAALLFAARKEGWDKRVLEDTYNAVLDRNITNEGFMKHGKAWLSPNGRVKARIYYNFDIAKVSIWAVCYAGKNREIGRRLLVEEKPSEAALLYFLGSVKWSSNKWIVLCSRHGSASWRVDLGDLTRASH
jgi:hypothetical protein